MVLDKQQMRELLETESVWVTSTRTELFAGGNVSEDDFRYIVAVWIKGNRQVNMTIEFERELEDGSFETMFSPIPVAPSDFRQIPKGSYQLEDPILKIVGGESLHGVVDLAGHSLNVTVNYYDWEV